MLDFFGFSAKVMLTNWPARNWKLKEDFYPEVPVEATACETQPKKNMRNFDIHVFF